jgi:hypothetical protein
MRGGYVEDILYATFEVAGVAGVGRCALDVGSSDTHVPPRRCLRDC